MKSISNDRGGWMSERIRVVKDPEERRNELFETSEELFLDDCNVVNSQDLRDWQMTSGYIHHTAVDTDIYPIVSRHRSGRYSRFSTGHPSIDTIYYGNVVSAK